MVDPQSWLLLRWPAESFHDSTTSVPLCEIISTHQVHTPHLFNTSWHLAVRNSHQMSQDYWDFSQSRKCSRQSDAIWFDRLSGLDRIAARVSDRSRFRVVPERAVPIFSGYIAFSFLRDSYAGNGVIVDSFHRSTACCEFPCVSRV